MSRLGGGGRGAQASATLHSCTQLGTLPGVRSLPPPNHAALPPLSGGTFSLSSPLGLGRGVAELDRMVTRIALHLT